MSFSNRLFLSVCHLVTGTLKKSDGVVVVSDFLRERRYYHRSCIVNTGRLQASCIKNTASDYESGPKIEYIMPIYHFDFSVFQVCASKDPDVLACPKNPAISKWKSWWASTLHPWIKCVRIMR